MYLTSFKPENDKLNWWMGYSTIYSAYLYEYQCNTIYIIVQYNVIYLIDVEENRIMYIYICSNGGGVHYTTHARKISTQRLDSKFHIRFLGKKGCFKSLKIMFAACQI